MKILTKYVHAKKIIERHIPYPPYTIPTPQPIWIDPTVYPPYNNQPQIWCFQKC